MALTTINSGGVKDDSIVNADIKSDAAIAGTKVAPDFGSQNIATTGNAGIGTTSPDQLLHLAATSNGPFIRLENTDTGISADQTFGGIEFESKDHSTGCAGVISKIDCISTAAFDGSSANGGELRFHTSGTNPISLQERLRIKAGGDVLIPASGADQKRSIRIDGTNGSSEIQGVVLESDGANALFHIKAGAGGGTPSNRLTINAISGNVGIGGTAPNYQLHCTTNIAVGGHGLNNQQLTIGNNAIQTLNLGVGYTPLLLNPTGSTVELYSGGSKKFETTANGAKVTGSSGSYALEINHPDWNTLQLVNTNNDQYGPYLDLYHASASPAVNDEAGEIRFLANDDAGGSVVYGQIRVVCDDVSNGSEDGHFDFYTRNNDSLEVKLRIGSFGETKVSANKGGDYAFFVQNDGNNTNRYGILVQCGEDTPTGSTSYAMGFADGDGGSLGYVKFTSSGLVYDPFTAAHHCIVPDADNPSDSSMAYPYGTLLETTEVVNINRGLQYKVQKTQTANSRKVLGAYGGSMNNGPSGETNLHDALILGDGHILVNNAGGNIEVGDGICSSATAGIGQKATANPSMIIGIAQEAITFTGSETKLVAVQYGLQQFIPWT